MTGFGKAEVSIQEKKIIAEIRSLNSKGLDINTKIPSIYRERDVEIRNAIGGDLLRGKVDVYITVEQADEANAPTINRSVFESYLKQLESIGSNLGMAIEPETLVQTILRLPDIFTPQKLDVTLGEWEALSKCISMALETINRFRIQEGSAMQTDLEAGVTRILTLLSDVKQYEQERIDAVRQRIMDAINNLNQEAKFDRNRFEQELIYYMEKVDINEEKVRLDNHCRYFLETLKSNEPVGRKLGFIAQEMGREINTLGSKANHDKMQRIVVLMKDELEKLKEQVLNVM